MSNILRLICSPILKYFESGTEAFSYKKSHRVILIIVGCLFSGLAVAVFFVAQGKDYGYFLPVIIFSCIALVCMVVGFLGTDRAVAKIWGSH